VKALRLLAFFLVGLALGGGSVAAFAAASDYGRSINLNSPSGGTARPPGWYGQPRYDWPDAPNGWGKLRDINSLDIGGKRVDIEGIRKFSPRTLAKVGATFARAVGPIGLGLTLGELVWDEAQGWLKPGEPAGEHIGGQWWDPYNVGVGFVGASPQAVCDQRQAQIDWAKLTATATGDPNTWKCLDASNQTMGWAYLKEPCPVGQIWNGTACAQAGNQPANDLELEDAIYTELVARGMGSELARRLIAAGYRPTPDGHEANGPTSVPGETTTSSTTGPSGTTTTTSSTVHNLTYNTNNTTNTTTVTVTNVTTHTTTAPDGTTTTTTETTTPSEGQQTEEPQYTLDYQGSAMPEIPDFYAQQYPDGFAGEWDKFKDKVGASPLAGFLTGLASGLPGGGTCPEWSVSLNFGHMGNFGTHVIAPPCAIWPFIKAVMILSALFVARRMVFGG